jgi:membrane protease YdiL (CAAX protease family)
MKIPIVDDLFELFRGENFRPTTILLTSVVTLVTWKTAGSQAFFHGHLADALQLSVDPREAAAWYQMVLGLVLLGIVPALVLRFVCKVPLASAGLGRGSLVRSLTLLALVLPFILWIAHDTAPVGEFRDVYPFNRAAGQSTRAFAVHIVMLGLLYLGWEFHFRGFLQQGLAGSLGASASVWVQVLASAMMHFDRPEVELWASVPAGLLWGLQANYTRSIWTGFAQHWLLGAALDYFICFG